LQSSAEKTNMKFLVTLIFILFWIVVLVSASTDEDLKKKYTPILGDYSFDLSSQGFGVLNITFYVENEKLLAITEVSSTPGQMEPVDGKDFEFAIEDPEEGTYSIKFLKDDTGKYTKCHISNESMGMDVIGEKVT
jgi:hypothetical protein